MRLLGSTGSNPKVADGDVGTWRRLIPNKGVSSHGQATDPRLSLDTFVAPRVLGAQSSCDIQQASFCRIWIFFTVCISAAKISSTITIFVVM